MPNLVTNNDLTRRRIYSWEGEQFFLQRHTQTHTLYTPIHSHTNPYTLVHSHTNLYTLVHSHTNSYTLIHSPAALAFWKITLFVTEDYWSEKSREIQLPPQPTPSICIQSVCMTFARCVSCHSAVNLCCPQYRRGVYAVEERLCEFDILFLAAFFSPSPLSVLSHICPAWRESTRV